MEQVCVLAPKRDLGVAPRAAGAYDDASERFAGLTEHESEDDPSERLHVHERRLRMRWPTWREGRKVEVASGLRSDGSSHKTREGGKESQGIRGGLAQSRSARHCAPGPITPLARFHKPGEKIRPNPIAQPRQNARKPHPYPAQTQPQSKRLAP